MELTVGALLRGSARRFLTEAKFMGELEDWEELKGLVNSRFLLRNPSQNVISQIEEWVASRGSH